MDKHQHSLILALMNYNISIYIEYVRQLKVTESQQQGIALRTIQQADDPSGEWHQERIGRLTASNFGHICKRKSKLDVLT